MHSTKLTILYPAISDDLGSQIMGILPCVMSMERAYLVFHIDIDMVGLLNRG